MPALRLLAPLCWTVLIAWLSTGAGSPTISGPLLLPWLERLLPWAAPEQLDALHWLARKAAHVTEYSVLAILWRWALEPRARLRGALAPLGLSLLTAALDEFHQTFVATRTGSPVDVVLDTSAAALGLIAVGGGARPALAALTTVLLWIAAAGGTALLALNWAAGAPSGWLWWSTPAGWLALIAWRRHRRRGA